MKLWKSLLIGSIAVFLVACQMAPLQPTVTEPVPYTLEKKQAERCIIEAGSMRGWLITPIKPGELQAELNIRQHQVVMRIVYDDKNITFNYVSSKNMNEKNGKIHRQYNNWLNNLRGDIKAKMNEVYTKQLLEKQG